MFVREKRRGDKTYLQIVENKWVNGKVKQRVLLSLGRLDRLQEQGELDRLLVSAQRFTEKVMVLNAHDKGESITTHTRRIGPALIFERLWQTLGIDKVLKSLLCERKFEFDVERAVYLTVLHRLFVSGSDRKAEKWRENYVIDGVEDLALHHLYRAMAWLGEELPETQQAGATPFAPRCTKDVIEERLFSRRRDLFTNLDVVFFDTTSIYFEGEGGDTIGRHGNSKDHRPDLKQMVVGVVLDGQGRPVCCELWPGNTTDVKTLLPIVERLRERFSITSVCVVADRGMISKDTIEELESHEGLSYILGARMRKQKEVNTKVLGRAGRYQEVYPKSRDPKAASPLKVKEVFVQKRRYVVCHNEDQAQKDAADRKAIIAGLKDKLRRGDKQLVGNKGYRKYIKTEGSRFSIDEDKIRAEARLDGKWVLRTNTQLSAKDTALKYKQLWMVEEVFRTTKSILETRPIFHKCDETIRGHVFCSFLSLILRKELQDRIESKGWRLEWDDVIDDLDNLLETEITVDGKGYVLRSETKGTVGKVSQAVGAALPPVLRPC